MTRLQMLGGGLITGLALVLATVAAGDVRAQDDARLARAVEELRSVLQRHVDHQELAEIRARQRTHLKAAGKFPDYIEVGVGVWTSVYDWHVKHQQPVAMQVLPTGSYGMRSMFSMLVLRADVTDDYIGLPYDADAPRR